ncbi:DUF6221 family protein [Nocardia sp. NPDC055165]
MTIAEFVAARLDEDEAAATRAARFRYDDPSDAPWVRMQLYVDRGVAMTSDAHFARHDPDRVLRQARAVRKVLIAYAAAQSAEDARVDDLAAQGLMTNGMDGDSEYASGRINALAETLAGVAAIWDKHPDYQPEWTPDQG